MQNELLMIGELAKKMDVSVRTLQYYDKEGLLKPSELSEGGRRMYSAEDAVKLYQILSMKSLGFPLDEIRIMMRSGNTTARVTEALKQQSESVTKKINELQNVLALIEGLRSEVIKMDVVDFNKYAEIVYQLKINNELCWVMNVLDEEVIEHVQNRYIDQPDSAREILSTYRIVLNEATELASAGESPNSKRSIALAKRWWEMVMEFTGGDMSLLPKLMAFNDDKSGWSDDMAEKQKLVDKYIGNAIEAYFSQNNIVIPEMEDKQ